MRLMVFSIICLLIPLLSCSATIYREGAPNTTARIESSSSEALYVYSDDNEVFKIPGTQIRDIDHPGNAMMTIGSIAAAMAVFFLFVDDERVDKRFTSIVYGGSGVGLFIGGLYTFLSSVNASSELDLSAPRNTTVKSMQPVTSVNTQNTGSL